MRLGVGAAANLSVLIRGSRLCKLCETSAPGIAHLLASCSALHGERGIFLDNVEAFYASKVRGSPAGDWPTLFLSPHTDLAQLRHAVVFAAAIMDALKKQT